MILEVGKIYLIKHTRKGTFMAMITGDHGDFTDAVIVGGKTEAMLDYNVLKAGDEVGFRTSFVSSAVEQPQAA